jgi:hypothetical protein
MRSRRNSALSSPRRLALAAVVAVGLVGITAVVATAAATGTAPASVRDAAGAGSAGQIVRVHGRSAAPASAVRAARTAGTSATASGPPRTSCASTAHIGDSTSVDLISTAYIPNPAALLQARYAAVGVKHLNLDASGGRSIVETLPGQVNGYNVAKAWAAQGFHGCWVFALGTNDAANVAVGSSVSMMARINEMMAVANGQPVMWVNTRTLLSYGPYANANEQAWNQTLKQALARYPNMRIFDWSSVAQPGWFLSDGIHYNTSGAAIRAQAIANALAKAFPLRGHSNGQIVR